jgi:hypothetical protein
MTVRRGAWRRLKIGVSTLDTPLSMTKLISSGSVPKVEIIDVDATPDHHSQKSSSLLSNQPVSSTKVLPASEHMTTATSKLSSNSKNEPKKKGSEAPPKEKKLTKKAMQALIKERAEREKKMSHKEYIETLPDKWPNRTKEYSQFLKGTVILFAERMWENRAAVRDKLDRVSAMSINYFINSILRDVAL